MFNMRFNADEKTLVITGATEADLSGGLQDLSLIDPAAQEGTWHLIIQSSQINVEMLQTIVSWLTFPKELLFTSFSGCEIELNSLSALPKSLSTLIVIKSKCHQKLLKGLRSPNRVRVLMVDSSELIRTGGLKYLKSRKGLNALIISGSELETTPNHGYSPTCERLADFSSLTHLQLTNTGLIDRDLSHIANCHGLEVLNLSDNPGIRNGVYWVSGMRNISSLNLAGCGVRTNDFRDIGDCLSLSSLNIERNPDLTDESFFDIGSARCLCSLSVSAGQIEAKGLSELLKISTLTELTLQNFKLPQNFGRHISSSCLKTLNVDGSDITVACLSDVSQCATLRSLSFKNTPAAKDPNRDDVLKLADQLDTVSF